MVGFFRKDGGYALYHSGSGTPLYRAFVAPDHPASPVVFVWQQHVRHRWKIYFITRDPVHLSANSGLDVYLNGVAPGIPYRVRIVFLADGDHLARAAPWSYFKAV
jgi:hypothetical protein